MIDIELIRKDPVAVIKALSNRQSDFTAIIMEISNLDKSNRDLIDHQEKLNATRNNLSNEFAKSKKRNDSASVEKIQEEVKKIKDQLLEINIELNNCEEQLTEKLYLLPNIPSKNVPVGVDEKDNKEIYRVGTIKPLIKNFLPHDVYLEEHKMADFKKAVLVSGTRQVYYLNNGAKLVRALENFMIDHHLANNYLEIMPCDMINAKALYGTGQLPKFKEDLFKIEGIDLYLSPTAEVQITNYFSDSILDGNTFPIKYCGYTHCFRAEAGSAGKDIKGIIRMHQFNKIEAVNIVKPEISYQALEELTKNVESILVELELPFRRIVLCTGDLGFSSAQTYDVEVWMPSNNTYREISSCSNFEDFQARRAKIRYKDNKTDKAKLVHTLNGSGLAIDRCLAALIENHQTEDGHIYIPQALRKYLNNIEKI